MLVVEGGVTITRMRRRRRKTVVISYGGCFAKSIVILLAGCFVIEKLKGLAMGLVDVWLTMPHILAVIVRVVYAADAYH